MSKQDENQVYPCDWCKIEADSLINLKNHRERIHLKSGTAVQDTYTVFIQEEDVKMENIGIKSEF